MPTQFNIDNESLGNLNDEELSHLSLGLLRMFDMRISRTEEPPVFVLETGKPLHGNVGIHAAFTVTSAWDIAKAYYETPDGAQVRVEGVVQALKCHRASEGGCRGSLDLIDSSSKGVPRFTCEAHGGLTA